MKRFRQMQAWLPVMTLLLVGGCSYDSTPLSTEFQTCFASTDCRGETVCLNGRCVPVPEAPLPLRGVDVEITPPAPLVRTQVLNVQTNEGEGLSVELEAPQMFPYTIVDPDGDLVGAQITVIGRARIAGRDVDATQRFIPGRKASLSLLRGSYSLRFEPSGATYPGVALSEFEVRDSTTNKEFELPQRFRRLTGLVRRRSDSNFPIEGVRVQAFALPSRLPSTEAITNPDGAYELLLPDSEETSFEVIATLAGDLQPAWGYRENIRVELDEDRSLNIGLVQTTTVSRGNAILRVFGVDGGGPTPVTDALVTLTASTSIPSQSFSIVGRTDDEGLVVIKTPDANLPLQIVAGVYEVRVEPPHTSPFASRVTTVDFSLLREAGQDKQVELEPRVNVLGTVLSPAGPLSGVRVEIDAVPARNTRVVTTDTDFEGLFRVRLDPGRYIVRVDPRTANTNEILPVGFQELLVLPKADLDTPRGAFQPKPVELQQGTVLTGVIGSGSPNGLLAVPGADVEFFVQVGGRARSLGRVSTDEAGRFQAIVPVTTSTPD